MPIRSPRGRAAAYRAVWQWPLRSPARLTITVVVVLAVVLAVSTLLTALNPPTPEAASSSSATPSSRRVPAASTPPSTITIRTPAPTALPPVADLAPAPRPPSTAPDVALEVAAGWAAAWVQPAGGTTAAQWLDGLRPLTTEEYLGVLARLDPRAIPATRVTGAPRAVSVAANTAEVEVPTDALTLLVLVVLTDAGDWRVSGYDRV